MQLESVGGVIELEHITIYWVDAFLKKKIKKKSDCGLSFFDSFHFII